jgi:cellobiose phosphorylase
LLGVRLEVDRLHIEPRIPSSWPAFDIHYRYRSALYHIHVDNLGASAHSRQVTRVRCDGLEQSDKSIRLHDDGRQHQVDIEIGGPELASRGAGHDAASGLDSHAPHGAK